MTYFTKYGCGPAAETIFSVNSELNDGSLILTQIHEKETGEIAEYYLVIAGGELSIGHGMCSGPYKFKEQNNYQIRFSAKYLSENINTGVCL